MIPDVVAAMIGIGEEEREAQRLSWFVRYATWGALAYSVCTALLRLYSIVVLSAAYGGLTDRSVYATVAVASCLPVQVWLVMSATRGIARRWQRLGLATLLVVAFGMIPVVGVGWVGMLYIPATLVLVTFRWSRSLVSFALLEATPAPLSFALGQPQWAAYYTLGMLTIAVPLAVVILLIRVMRELQDARLALAQQAVVRERLRIDDEVRESVGFGLAGIANQGQRTAEVAVLDPSAAARELRVLVDAARRTMAETRRIVTRYRETSLEAELKTVATLLSTAGIDARVELPPNLSRVVDERDRAWLRKEVARLLADNLPPASVTITVSPDHGRPRIEIGGAASREAPQAALR